MKVVFRVDQSPLIGSGHLVRCHTLAGSLRDAGAEVGFICAGHAGSRYDLLVDDKFPVALLPRQEGSSGASWLGASEAEDAQQTLAALGGQAVDWLVVDHYGISQVWERTLRAQTRFLMAIDDLANRNHVVDLVLDQNFSADNETKYLGLVPDGCERLIGPGYALLQAPYQKAFPLRESTGVGRIFVFFGGVDAPNLTGLILDSLSEPPLSTIDVDIVIGAMNPHRGLLLDQAARRGRVWVHENLPSLAPLMIRADLAVGAGGGTTWERMCTGLPSLVVSIADNQVPACQLLALEGLIRYVGPAETVSKHDIAQGLRLLIDDPQMRIGMAKAGRALVDGAGASRVAARLFARMPASIDASR